MAITYVLTEDRHTVDGKCYIFYGIAAFDEERALVAVRDVSKEKERIEQLIEACNRLALSPLHLHDVVEDFLVEEALKEGATADRQGELADDDFVATAR